jgi:hypothetical protein
MKLIAGGFQIRGQSSPLRGHLMMLPPDMECTRSSLTDGFVPGRLGLK